MLLSLCPPGKALLRVAAVSHPLHLVARLGFAAKGLIYATVGLLAFQAAAGMGGRITDSDGALRAILRQPFGHTLLLVLAIGLFGYAAWRTVQGLVDSERRGKDVKGLALRASFVARGALHAFVGWKVLQLYRGLAIGAGRTEDRLVAATFTWPLGDWVVVLGGLGLMGFAIYQCYRAVKTKLGKHFNLGGLRRDLGEWAVHASRIGLAARGAVFAIIAWYLIRAGMTRRAGDAAGTADAIRVVANWPAPVGSWLLGAIGAGLVAYGFYQVLHAKYREIPT
jgi:hypothetical protein